MRPLPTVLTALLLIGCADDPTSVDEPFVDVTATATVTNGDGATLELTTSDDVQVTVTVPPGAVVDDTDFQITSVEPGTEQWLRLRISPAGRLLAPASLDVTMPPSWSPSLPPTLVIGDGAVPATYDATGRTLAYATHFFGYAGGGAAASPGAGSGQAAPSGEITAAGVDCPNLVIALNAKIQTVESSGTVTPEEAKQIVDEYRTLDKHCSGQGPALEQIEGVLQTLACSRYAQARQELFEGPDPTDASVIEPALERLAAAEALRLESSAECGYDVQADASALFEEYMRLKQEQYGDPDYVMGIDTWHLLWLELKTVIDVAGLAGAFALDDVVDRMKQDVMAPLMELFRDKAYRACFGSAGLHVMIADLQSAGLLLGHPIGDDLPEFVPFEATDLDADIQYCASRLEVESFDGDFLSSSHILDQDILDYTIENEASVTGHDGEGRIVLGGQIRAIKCFLSPTSVDQLELWADNTLLTTFDPVDGVLLGSPYEIDVPALVSQLGALPGSDITLSVRRVGMCSGYVDASTTYALFTVNIQVET